MLQGGKESRGGGHHPVPVTALTAPPQDTLDSEPPPVASVGVETLSGSRLAVGADKSKEWIPG